MANLPRLEPQHHELHGIERDRQLGRDVDLSHCRRTDQDVVQQGQPNGFGSLEGAAWVVKQFGRDAPVVAHEFAAERVQREYLVGRLGASDVLLKALPQRPGQ